MYYLSTIIVCHKDLYFYHYNPGRVLDLSSPWSYFLPFVLDLSSPWSYFLSLSLTFHHLGPISYLLSLTFHHLGPISYLIYLLLYENIDQILLNKLHGPMHYTIGVICLFSGYKINTLL